MAKVGIFYGSTEGNTERVVEQLKDMLGDGDLHNVDSATKDDLEGYDNLILACSTWEIGELQEDYEEFLDVLEDADLSGKKVAFLGTGDAMGYPDTFVDAIGIIYEKIADKGITVVGQVATDDYEYDASRGEIDGKFIGLPIDEDNESDKTEERLSAWAEVLKPEFGL